MRLIDESELTKLGGQTLAREATVESTLINSHQFSSSFDPELDQKKTDHSNKLIYKIITIFGCDL